jgi:hypothetical protein
MGTETNYQYREAEHPSQNDARDHYTGVCYDANGQYVATEHFTKQE